MAVYPGFGNHGTDWMDKMTDREFWTVIRRALLLFVDAIEKRYRLGKYQDVCVQPIGENDTIVGVVYKDTE
jgi:hypothetical protein